MILIGRYIAYDIEEVLELQVQSPSTDYELESSMSLTLNEFDVKLNVLRYMGIETGMFVATKKLIHVK